VELFEMPIY